MITGVVGNLLVLPASLVRRRVASAAWCSGLTDLHQ
jgi:hypothetical protein